MAAGAGCSESGFAGSPISSDPIGRFGECVAGAGLTFLAHYQEEPRPAGLSDALIKRVLIERMHEYVARRPRAVRWFDGGRLAQELAPPRQFLEHLLDLYHFFFQAGGH